jgi:hypothetical protein
VKSTYPHPKENIKDLQSRHLANLVFSIFLFLGALAFIIMAVLWSLTDITGEYSCVSPRIGMVRLSLFRKGEVLRGDLTYSMSPKLELITSSSASQEEVNLSFAPPREFPRRGVITRVNLIGKFQHGSIFGVVVDGGTPYPINLHRNVVYSLIRRVSSIFGG